MCWVCDFVGCVCGLFCVCVVSVYLCVFVCGACMCLCGICVRVFVVCVFA